VVVHPRAEEADLVLGARVAGGERAQVREHLLLGHAGRQVERPPQPDALGHDREELLDRRDADLGQHDPEVLVGERGVAGPHRPDRYSR
jgi:hypothetical protein